MGYLHVQIDCEQLSKVIDRPCGDAYDVLRTELSTIIILCDGLGSGVKANLSATLAISRIKQLLVSGFSIRQTFEKVVNTMEEAKGKDLPYAVFTILRIQKDGVTNILTYEMPPPIFVSNRFSSILENKIIEIGSSKILDTNSVLKKGEGILLVSDGISYSGIGGKIKTGWGIEGTNKFVNDLSYDVKNKTALAGRVLKKAKQNWGETLGDDCSVLFARCLEGSVVNILTGPPVKRGDDVKVVEKFMELGGTKIVCGATTAKIVAKETGKELEMSSSYSSLIAPPNYEIDGIDLVTEGAITLNQLYNVWDEDYKSMEKGSPVTELYHLIKSADRINIFVGNSYNLANNDISFKQTGILNRRKIVPLLKKCFEEDEKLVHVEYY